MSGEDPLKTLFRELVLAASMICILVAGMWALTGSMPPLVVVESASMVHDAESGEIGSIDAGDLVLVYDVNPSMIITFAEATDDRNPRYGHESHGMPGDVVIFRKNGMDGTPIIHRAIFRAVPHSTISPTDGECSQGSFDPISTDPDTGKAGVCVLTWDVPGTDQIDVEKISVMFDGEQAGLYECGRNADFDHGFADVLTISEWDPGHAGLLTLGDANKCSVDQGGSASQGSQGLHTTGGVVGAVRDDWVIGKAGEEIPWLGVVKLMVSGGDSPGVSQVPGMSFVYLFITIAAILVLPMVLDPLFRVALRGAPEYEELKRELALDSVIEALKEEE